MKSRIGSAVLVVLVGLGLTVSVNGCGGSGSSSGSTQTGSTGATTAEQAPEAVVSLTINSTCSEWTSATAAEQKNFISQVVIPAVRFEKNLIWSDVVNTCEESASEETTIRYSLGTAVK
jgi:hypothetical protein